MDIDRYCTYLCASHYHPSSNNNDKCNNRVEDIAVQYEPTDNVIYANEKYGKEKIRNRTNLQHAENTLNFGSQVLTYVKAHSNMIQILSLISHSLIHTCSIDYIFFGDILSQSIRPWQIWADSFRLCRFITLNENRFRATVDGHRTHTCRHKFSKCIEANKK